MWLAFAFSTLGLLIGTLIGLTAESVVKPVLALLFAFMGGSVIALLNKLSPEDRKLASQAIAALSLASLLGVYSGIVVTQYRLLSPSVRDTQQHNTTVISQETYLRSALADKANTVDIRYKKNLITLEQAYQELYALANKGPTEGPQQ